jgi:hypothetical protein
MAVVLVAVIAAMPVVSAAMVERLTTLHRTAVMLLHLVVKAKVFPGNARLILKVVKGLPDKLKIAALVTTRAVVSVVKTVLRPAHHVAPVIALASAAIAVVTLVATADLVTTVKLHS